MFDKKNKNKAKEEVSLKPIISLSDKGIKI